MHNYLIKKLLPKKNVKKPQIQHLYKFMLKVLHQITEKTT